jgi:hypothetical protein
MENKETTPSIQYGYTKRVHARRQPSQPYLLGQHVVAQAAPVRGQLLARVEGVGGERHGLDAPAAPQVGVQRVQHRGGHVAL